MKDAMIDLETLGLSLTDAPILQAAIVMFDRTLPGSGASFETKVQLESSIELGRSINPDTLRWWLTQDPKLFAEMIAKTGGVSIYVMCAQLARFIQDEKPDRVWSNGVGFDISMLELLFAEFGMETPWHFRAPRDTRTFWETAQLKLPEFPDKDFGMVFGIGEPLIGMRKHDALDDCLMQIRRTQIAYRIIMADKAEIEEKRVSGQSLR